jgi:hypothetical protein
MFTQNHHPFCQNWILYFLDVIDNAFDLQIFKHVLKINRIYVFFNNILLEFK